MPPRAAHSSYLHVLTRTGGAARVVPLTGTLVRVGRGAGCDVPIDDPRLADVHCVLRRRGEGWTVEPAGLAGRVLVDGVTIQGPQPLSPGATVRIGEVRLSLHALVGDADPSTPGSFETPLAVEATSVEPRVLASGSDPAVPSPIPDATPAPSDPDADSEAERLARWQASLEFRERWLASRREEQRWEQRWRSAGDRLKARSPAGLVGRAPSADPLRPRPEPPRAPDRVDLGGRVRHERPDREPPTPPVHRPELPPRPVAPSPPPTARRQPPEPFRRPVFEPIHPDPDRDRDNTDGPVTLLDAEELAARRAWEESNAAGFRPDPTPAAAPQPADQPGSLVRPLLIESDFAFDLTDATTGPAVEPMVDAVPAPPAAPGVDSLPVAPDPTLAPIPEPVRAESVALVDPGPEPVGPSPAVWLPTPVETEPSPAVPADERARSVPPAPEPDTEPTVEPHGLAPLDRSNEGTPWPSAREILEAHRARVSEGERSPVLEASRRRRPVPTAAQAPESWTLPAAIAVPPAVALTLFLGGLGLALCWLWAQDQRVAASISDRLLAGQSLPPSGLEADRLPSPSWWGSTADHLYGHAVALGTPDDPTRSDEIRFLLGLAAGASPLHPGVRFSAARLRPEASTDATDLNLSRDILPMALAGRHRLAAGDRERALLHYREALELAVRSDPADSAEPRKDTGSRDGRLLLPNEDLIAPIIRELAAYPGWSYEDWKPAIPEEGVALLATYRVLRDRNDRAADRVLDRLITAESDPEGAAPWPAVERAARAEARAERRQWREAEALYRTALAGTTAPRLRHAWWLNLAEIEGRLNDFDARRAALDRAWNEVEDPDAPGQSSAGGAAP